MSDIEIEIEVEAEEVEVEVEGGGDAAAEGEEKKEKPKRDETPLRLEDLVPVECPDEYEYAKSKKEAQDQLDLLINKISGLTAQVDKLAVTRSSCMEKRKAIQEAQAALKTERQQASEAASIAQDTLDVIEKQRFERRRALDVHKQGLKFTKVEDLDNAVSKIQTKLTTAGLPRDVQQKLLNDLNGLKQQRQKVLTYTALRQLAEAEKVDIAGPIGILENEKKVNTEANKAQKKHSEDYNKVRDTEKVVRKEIEGLIKERSTLGKEKYKLTRTVNDIERKYNNKLRNYTRYIEKVKYIKRVEARAARAARQKEWEEQQGRDPDDPDAEPKEDEVPKDPWFKELQICQDLITYLNALLPKSVSTPKAEEASNDDVKVESRNAGFKGKATASLTGERDEGAEWTAAAREAFGQKKKRVRNKKVKVAFVNHIPDVFPKFKTIGVEAPNTTTQVEERLAAVQEKLEYYKTAPPPAKKEKKEKESPKKSSQKEDTPTEAAADPAEQAERKRNRRKSIQLQDAEQQRRIEEAASEANEANASQVKERRASVALATEMANAEQTRRVAEAEAEAIAEQEERKANVRRASLMLDEEQSRRIAESSEEKKEGAIMAAKKGSNKKKKKKKKKKKGGAAATEDAAEDATEDVAEDAAPVSDFDLTAALQTSESARTGADPTAPAGPKKASKAAVKPAEGGDALTAQLQAAETSRK